MNQPAPVTLAAAVLAGGRSSRMGRDKAFLTWRGETLLARQLRLLRTLAPDEVLVSGRAGVDYGTGGVPVVCDAEPDRGPLGGLAALFAATRTSHLLVVAVDLPELGPDLLQALVAGAVPGRGVVPRGPRGWEPLVAVYPRCFAARVTAALASGRGALHPLVDAALAAGEVVAFDLSPAWQAQLTNWNRPEDFAG
jgi:molybdenum cofactor guanylyltransferase